MMNEKAKAEVMSVWGCSEKQAEEAHASAEAKIARGEDASMTMFELSTVIGEL